MMDLTCTTLLFNFTEFDCIDFENEDKDGALNSCETISDIFLNELQSENINEMNNNFGEGINESNEVYKLCAFFNRQDAIQRWRAKRSQRRWLYKDPRHDSRRKATQSRDRENGKFRKRSTHWIPVDVFVHAELSNRVRTC